MPGIQRRFQWTDDTGGGFDDAARGRRRSRRNTVKDAAYMKAYNVAHREEHKAYRRRYRQIHKDQLLAYDRKRGHAKSRTIKGRFAVLRAGAKRRGIEVTLDVHQYCALIGDSVCHYCGGALPEAGSGMDRQDHRLGYTPENVVPCCGVCNSRKGKLEGIGFTYPRTVELLMELIADAGRIEKAA